ncbi:hypothetical protein N7537_005513 [Penicillium hordei]|uniref:Uncharacterized protein n=1 Tax=Penicillium hordei TaxID=40994 RepID=A0AAD6E729_9EURO|nr:uncharacterized protein N7537_005513 [Penicillium hordei]KAJ5602557.1 hypothetical protein N7537_005513 [Penicillium hordei]
MQEIHARGIECIWPRYIPVLRKENITIVNTPNVFRGTCQVTGVPKRLATCQRTRKRKPGLIWVWTCMGLNNVDVSCIGTRVATGPFTYAVSWWL